MPRFEPFRALRFATSSLDTVIAPPYDVLSDADVDALEARSPTNIVRVDVPRGGPDRYRRAAETLADWQRRGVLVPDATETFTIYRMRFTDAGGARRNLAGVVGGLELTDPGSGGVLPHERTTPKASTDRLDLTRATRANLSPVWGLSLASGLTALLDEPAEQVGRVMDEGVEHAVERVSDPDRIAAIRDQLAADDVLIADGHHRYAISRSYRDEVRAATGRTDTAAEQTLAFVGELVAEQLSVEAIHRLYDDVSLADLRAALATRFELTPLPEPTPATLAAMQAEGFLVLVGPDRAERLTPRAGAFDGVRSLDGVWLEETLANVPASVSYQHGLGEVTAAVRDGRATAAVLIRPVSVDEIERTAREGLLMPPKSTFFTPKLKTGFVIRQLGD
ncbi:DUF1015 domain-containing protein [Microlunatus panaciterrae]|uniref:Uncharacterized protein (DUF1015 family) n=1 Tax=Microlunatus panaciterrae TaxID=400768 RepID=A0ABS2RE98_9ACTN|nr:uncharacterized protein (DUF1015 family) [Microlunatus panaciterrae]